MSKKILPFALALIFSIISPVAALSESLEDQLPDHPGWTKASEWALPELKKAYDVALIPRTLLGADMTKNITRAQFAALAVQLYENLTGKTAPSAPADTFSDTGLDFVLQAYQLGIVKGAGNGKFDPFGNATREQTATMLCRAIEAISGMDTDGPYSDYSESFSDMGDVSEYAEASMMYMTNSGFIVGTGDMLLPKSPCTREQAICLTYRIYEMLA
ncbi:MAG: S-layer homology domain-containing protein [Oscillospiraceae bacterium]|nr:S-layer homology domain-containing protein [Oscillospiraceae bacterium]